ncbi:MULTISPECIES: hypothetical protein [unclassified Prevotella]|uniref:hypothetical protein n=1 Tax=unclassified Prevotella TaxID=2638335 RepID=UPI00117DAD18|nr:MULTISPECIES: hypothetical protein [unclassified Prevotella]
MRTPSGTTQKHGTIHGSQSETVAPIIHEASIQYFRFNCGSKKTLSVIRRILDKDINKTIKWDFCPQNVF